MGNLTPANARRIVTSLRQRAQRLDELAQTILTLRVSSDNAREANVKHCADAHHYRTEAGALRTLADSFCTTASVGV